jgi:hypothetical protein
MELCDPSLFELLMTASLRPRTIRSTFETPQTQRRVAPQRCSCGQCPTCLHNARWERIFQEHFADPDYYAPRPLRHASSLDYRRKDQGTS